ncbi:MAG: helix-turn-helix transcriptional regulator [Sphingobacteriales bacterium]|nr:helix-turn-helix transcriptional regulator [Sphingobacteriales bacterium]
MQVQITIAFVMDKKAYLQKLGQHIACLRISKGISQAEFARCCDKDPQSLNRLEKGRINPSIIYLQQIADELNISLKELFDFKKNS